MSNGPITAKAFMEFFEGQGARFIDSETGKPLIDPELSLCESCHCMTRTFIKDNTCMKCGAKKGV